MTDVSSNFNDQYMAISAKLKKRFLRKPNISEITNEFNALAIQCEKAELPTFAGHTYIGAAKCENSIGNILGEANFYLKAARKFMEAQMNLSSLNCESPGREDVEAAIGCYMQAFAKYPETSTMRSSIMWEIANNLEIMNHDLEAIHYYGEVVALMGDQDRLKYNCMCKIMELSVKCGKYDDALVVANFIADAKINAPLYMLFDIDVNRVLLGLLVPPTGETHTPSLMQLYETLASDTEDSPLGTDLKLHLQSIVVCCRDGDAEGLREATALAGPWLNTLQRGLLVQLVKYVEN